MVWDDGVSDELIPSDAFHDEGVDFPVLLCSQLPGDCFTKIKSS